MRLHTNATPEDVITAVETVAAQVSQAGFEQPLRIVGMTTHRSGKAERGIELQLAGNSRSHPGYTGGQTSASWDEWGTVLGRLYQIDPSMVCGQYYSNAQDFDRQTVGRFTEGVLPQDAHARHDWRIMTRPEPKMMCSTCSATRKPKKK